MTILRAYFDESGTHAGSRVTGVAGYIGPVEAWDALEAEWVIELQRFSNDTGRDISAFHAYDCENGEDYWVGIQRSIREAYYQRLARVISKYGSLNGIAICVENNACNMIATAQFKERYDTTYGLCA
jgi:hypothetical protein